MVHNKSTTKEGNKMNKQISKAGSNKAGTWVQYTDGSSIKYVASLGKTFVEDKAGNKTTLDGRQGI